VLAKCCQSESSKFRDMAPLEGLLQSGEGRAEEGSMRKCHEVSRGGATKGSIGMEGRGKGCCMSSSQSFVAGVC